MRRATERVVIVVYGLLTIAAIGKLVDLQGFRLGLSRWHIVSDRMATALALIVPLIEVLLVVMFVLAPRRCVVHGAALIFLSILTVGYVTEAYFSGQIECNCLGLILAQEAWMSSFWGVLVRNALLMAVLVIWLASHRALAATAGAKVPDATRCRSALPSGFTLIELLISITVIAVLIGIALPALGHFKREAHRASILTYLRQHAATIQMYAHDWNDSVPAIVRSYDQPYRIEGGGQTANLLSLYFETADFWNIALADGYFNGRLQGPDLQTEPERSGAIWSNLTMSASLLASPTYWTRQRDTTSLHQLGPVRMGMCTFPTAKVMMLDEWEFYGARLHAAPNVTTVVGGSPVKGVAVPPPPPLSKWTTSIAMMDGSAKRTVGTEWVPSTVGVFHPMLWDTGAEYLKHTYNGVFGRDLK